jgi:hypothetical protein
MIGCFDCRVEPPLPPQLERSDRLVRAVRHVLLQCDRIIVVFLAGNRLVARISRPSMDFFHRCLKIFKVSKYGSRWQPVAYRQKYGIRPDRA